jgi:hypothetical protein
MNVHSSFSFLFFIILLSALNLLLVIIVFELEEIDAGDMRHATCDISFSFQSLFIIYTYLHLSPPISTYLHHLKNLFLYTLSINLSQEKCLLEWKHHSSPTYLAIAVILRKGAKVLRGSSVKSRGLFKKGVITYFRN